MNVLNIDVTSEAPPQMGRFRVYPIGDLHWDEKTCDRDRFRRYRDMIAADPHGLWVFVGDAISGTTPGHRFFDPATTQALDPEVFANLDKYVTYMLDELVKEMEPLRDRPGIIIQGNHDVRRGIQWSGLAWALANRLGPNVQYGGDEALVRVRASTSDTRGRNVWTMHCCHGAGGGMLPGGKLWRHQRDITSLTTAEIAIRGHVHDSLTRIIYLYDVTRKSDKARLVEVPRAFLTAPGFMRSRIEGVNSYAATKTYPSTDQGLIYIEVHNPSPGARSWNHQGKIFRHEAPF